MVILIPSKLTVDEELVCASLAIEETKTPMMAIFLITSFLS
jgi:hypothetical protein